MQKVVEQPVKPIYDMGEDGKKLFPVFIIPIDSLTSIASAGSMINGSGKFDTQRAGHSVT
jgi:hypothetical protein